MLTTEILSLRLRMTAQCTYAAWNENIGTYGASIDVMNGSHGKKKNAESAMAARRPRRWCGVDLKIALGEKYKRHLCRGPQGRKTVGLLALPKMICTTDGLGGITAERWRRAGRYAGRLGLAWVIVLFAAGCASPGHPLPPSLKIPRQATDLTVERVGDEVRLHWTTPGRTTDGAQVSAGLVAQICRGAVSPTAGSPAGRQPIRQTPGRAVPSCAVVAEVPVRPGPSDAVDRLPGQLVSGAPMLLDYKVLLLGPNRKTAGPSAAVFTLAGPGPGGLAEFRATNTADGALLRWTRKPAAGPDESVRLERTTVNGNAPSGARAGGSSGAVTNLTAGAGDPGGVVDRMAGIGETYSYTAQRVRNATVEGRVITLRGPIAGPVSVTMRDVFPPSAPAGLVGSPGPGSIDLSWEPVEERAGGDKLAGYRIYREAEGATNWTLLTTEPVTVPAYRDQTVQAGASHRYRVTAVDAAGKESAPSAEVSETAGQR